MTLAADPFYGLRASGVDEPDGTTWPSQAHIAAETPGALPRINAPDRALFEFALLNLAAGALLGAAVLQGWVGTVVAADSTGLALAISGVFLIGLITCAIKLRSITRELKDAQTFAPREGSLAADYRGEVADRSAGSRAISAAALKTKLSQEIAMVRHLANSLVLLGLIGTVLGFIIALSGVDPERASDVSSIAPMVSQLIRGMSVALYTTLVGSVLNLWLMMNYRILAGNAVRLATDLIALGERHARA